MKKIQLIISFAALSAVAAVQAQTVPTHVVNDFDRSGLMNSVNALDAGAKLQLGRGGKRNESDEERKAREEREREERGKESDEERKAREEREREGKEKGDKWDKPWDRDEKSNLFLLDNTKGDIRSEATATEWESGNTKSFELRYFAADKVLYMNVDGAETKIQLQGDVSFKNMFIRLGGDAKNGVYSYMKGMELTRNFDGFKGEGEGKGETRPLSQEWLMSPKDEASSTGLVIDKDYVNYAEDWTLRGGVGFLFEDKEKANFSDASIDLMLVNTSNVAPVPEPASMIALGFGAMAMLRRRKK